MAKRTGTRNINRLQHTAVTSLAAVRKTRESADASVRVINKRLALSVAALSDPITADYDELGRMIPEKVSAMSATSLIFGEKSALLAFRFLRQMSDETMRATTHLQAMAAMRDPVSALTAQMSYMVAASQRMADASLLFAASSATLINAASGPVHRAVMANAKRLG